MKFFTDIGRVIDASKVSLSFYYIYAIET